MASFIGTKGKDGNPMYFCGGVGGLEGGREEASFASTHDLMLSTILIIRQSSANGRFAQVEMQERCDSYDHRVS